MRSLRIRAALALVLAAILLAAGLAVASAEEPPLRYVTRLEPGDNLITWRDPSVPVQDLFDAVPQVEVVFGWDAQTREWLVAAPAAPQSLWTLHSLEPGAELAVRIVGAEAVEWERERALVAGPDVRYFGWVGESESTQQLFDEMPQIDSIYAWDASSQQWLTASSTASDELLMVQPGMGLRVQFNGSAPEDWERPLTPARGLVKLIIGQNLVTWSGPNETPIAKVVQGIGRALEQARRWNAAEQRFDIYDPSDPESAASFPSVARGDALWIHVSRPVNWLQPTGLMPALEFPGGASNRLQEDLQEDLQSVLQFFATTFGIQADPSDLTVLAAKDVDSLVEYYKTEPVGDDEFDEAQEASLRAQWNRSGGWAGEEMVVKQVHWSSQYRSLGFAVGRYVLTHEYFHWLQSQLRSSGAGSATWLVEGTADWAEEAHQIEDQRVMGSELRFDAREAAGRGPSLESTETENGTWQYLLGSLATDMLAERGGVDSPLEFYRALVPRPIGPHLRWHSSPRWQDVFSETFGLTVDEFYAEFSEWQADLPGSRPFRRESYERSLTGRLVRADGTPVGGVWLSASQVEDDVTVGWLRRARSDQDGRFELFVPHSTNNRLEIDLAADGHCRTWYADGTVVLSFEDATLVRVGTGKPQSIEIVVPDDVCRWRIRGRLIGPDGDALHGFGLNASAEDQWASTTTDTDGAFAITVPENGDFRLSLALGGGCSVYYRDAGIAVNYSDATQVQVRGGDTAQLELRVAADICVWQLRGRALDDSGVAAEGIRIGASRDAHTRISVVSPSGSFAVTVPSPGQYRIRISGRADPNCTAYVGEDAQLVEHGEARLYRVDARDLTNLTVRVPTAFCTHTIAGVLFDRDGSPLTETWISAAAEGGGSAGVSTDEEGTFALTVPISGMYRVSFSVENCTVYYSQEGATSKRESAAQITVSDADVTGIRLALRDGVCSTKISGVLLDAEGNPLGGVNVNANDGTGSNANARTDADGSFSITLPSSGSYRLQAWLNGCPIYYSPGRATASWSDASEIRIADADVTGLRFQLPAGACSTKISGLVLDAEGNGIASAWVHAQIDGRSSTGHQTSADGSFSITLPEAGGYRLSISIDGCPAYYARGGATSSREAASLIRVADQDVTGLRFQLAAGMCSTQVRGVLLDADGESMEDVWVYANTDGGNASARTDADGAFAITVPEAGGYRLSISIDGCPAYYARGGATSSREAASLIRVADEDVTGLRFQLAAGICSTQIRGVLLDADGESMEDVWVYANTDGGNASARTDADGAFAITVPEAGGYRLRISIDGCSVYYVRGGATISWEAASLIRVADQDVTGLRFQLAAGMCSTQVRGVLLDADGNGIGGVNVNANDGAGSNANARTDADGAFAITVPAAGRFRVSARVDGCTVYYASNRVTGSRNSAVQIRIGDADVTGIQIRIPADMCVWRISGKLLNADGSPKSAVWVSASGVAGNGGAQSDTDGAFSFAVPGRGSYRLSVWIDNCSIYRRGDRSTTNWNSATTISITNADVTGVDFRLPTNPGSLCN